MAQVVFRPTDIQSAPVPAYSTVPRSSARLPRWSLLLIGLTALLAVAVIALLLLVLKKAPRRAAAAAGAVAVQPPIEKANEARVDPQAGRSRPRVAVPAAADLPLRKRNDAAASAKSPFQDPLLEVVGSLTAAHLYQTYLNVNLLADGAEAELYTRDDANKMLEEVADLLDGVERQLARVPENKLKDEDRKSLAQVRLLMGLLHTQTRELKAYWDSGAREHADRFHKAREAAKTGIRDLLDLPE